MARITFGIISLNGLPFLKYNLRSLYDFAHEIIVVEGAVDTARSLARPDGHSQDGTWEFLQDFQHHSDPQKKLSIISAIDQGYVSGFWPEKDEMSQAYAKKATGEWLWQVDGDEFYKQPDLKTVNDLLDSDPLITQIGFPYYEFWGGFDYIQRGEWHDVISPEFRRLFRWGAQYTYANHRPPTVLDQNGVDLSQKKFLTWHEMKRRGIWLYHYSYVLPIQAEFKVKYYQSVNWTQAFQENPIWLDERYTRFSSPFRIGEIKNRLQWLVRFKGSHPQIIEELKKALYSGKEKFDLRDTKDIEAVISRWYYPILAEWLLPLILILFWRIRVVYKKLKTRIPPTI